MGQDSCYKSLAIVQDRLCWDCFVEGRIYKLFLQVMKPCLREVGRRSVDQWGQDFVKSLLHLTHKQWLFRNARKHIRLMDGMTEAEHLEVYDRVEELIHLDPADLLPKHQYLLDDDFSKMGESSSIARKVWVLNVESAAANSVKGGTAIADGIARFNLITTTCRSSFPQAVSQSGWRSRSFEEATSPAQLWQDKLEGLQRARSTVVQIQCASSVRHKSGSIRYVQS